MLLSSKQLVGLPVVTRGGMVVGKVAGFKLETDTGRLASLHVKARGLVPGLLDQELVIGWNEIIELSDNQVVVKDGSVPVGGRVLAARPSPNT